MSTDDYNPADPFMPLADLARQPGVTRTALELAIRARKLTVISRFGQFWVHRADARDWLRWRASVADPSAPLHEIEL